MAEFFRFLLHRNTFSPLVRPVSVSSCLSPRPSLLTICPPFCLSPAVLSPLSSLPCAPPVMISLGTLPPSNFCAVHRPSSLLSRPSSPLSLVFVCCRRRRHLLLLLSPFLLTFSPPPLAFPLPLPSSFPPSSLFLSSALLFSLSLSIVFVFPSLVNVPVCACISLSPSRSPVLSALPTGILYSTMPRSVAFPFLPFFVYRPLAHGFVLGR